MRYISREPVNVSLSDLPHQPQKKTTSSTENACLSQRDGNQCEAVGCSWWQVSFLLVSSAVAQACLVLCFLQKLHLAYCVTRRFIHPFLLARSLTDQQVNDMGIKMLPGYSDPYGKRWVSALQDWPLAKKSALHSTWHVEVARPTLRDVWKKLENLLPSQWHLHWSSTHTVPRK